MFKAKYKLFIPNQQKNGQSTNSANLYILRIYIRIYVYICTCSRLYMKGTGLVPYCLPALSFSIGADEASTKLCSRCCSRVVAEPVLGHTVARAKMTSNPHHCGINGCMVPFCLIHRVSAFWVRLSSSTCLQLPRSWRCVRP